MHPYILLAAIFGIGAYLEDVVSKDARRRWLHVGMIVFLAIVGFRYRHGDYGTYEWGYNLGIDVGEDWGYYNLGLLFRQIGLSFQTFVFFLTAVSIYAFRKAFKLSPWPLFGWLVILGKIFTLYAMSGIRQYMAIALCWWAIYELLANRRRILFFLLVAIAYTFHGSAIILLPVYFFRDTSFSYIKGVLLIGVSVVLAYYSNLVFAFAIDSSEIVSDRFGGYVSSSAEGVGMGMNLLNYLENFLFLFLALLVRPKAIQKVPYYDFFLYMFIIYCGFLIVGDEVGIVKRLRDYYSLAYAILVPSYVYLFKSKDQQICKLVLSAYFILLMFRSLYVYDSVFPSNAYGRMIPYHSVLDKGSMSAEYGIMLNYD